MSFLACAAPSNSFGCKLFVNILTWLVIIAYLLSLQMEWRIKVWLKKG